MAEALLSEQLRDQLDEVQQRQRRGLALFFWVGVVVFLIGAGSVMRAASGEGQGSAWIGGMIGGVLLLMRSAISYAALRRSGDAALSNATWVMAMLALLAVFATGTIAMTIILL
ncbi:hypothetical protein [Kineosporia babensis]|uniref:Uncharacterized protein n=1 Tax=Kineosporia babensis TaxID=499548 RepID=A0A9X1NF64_9ACTN|nr:hypothetical protein [Kineosporia babensis]MCD5312749.1 hypothetical protein [Kineosporia babensis]